MLTRGRELTRFDADWLTSHVDKWIKCRGYQGYSKLRSRLLSRGCQTMMDRSLPHRAIWSRSDSELLNDLIPATNETTENNNASTLSLDETKEEEDDSTTLEKQLQYDRDIADYIAYLNRPIINMNDHYIEIHQYHYEPRHLQQEDVNVPIRPPTRRKKHKVDFKKTEIIDCRGLSPVKTSEYTDFLVRKSPVRNINIVESRKETQRSSDEENKEPKESLDRHRPLKQKEKTEKKLETVVNKEGHVKVKRGQTFSTISTKDANANPPEAPHRAFLSFRTSKKNKSGRRKKSRILVGEAGVEGPIWPAVLLTFDRTISPAPPDSPDESQV